MRLVERPAVRVLVVRVVHVGVGVFHGALRLSVGVTLADEQHHADCHQRAGDRVPGAQPISQQKHRRERHKTEMKMDVACSGTSHTRA